MRTPFTCFLLGLMVFGFGSGAGLPGFPRAGAISVPVVRGPRWEVFPARLTRVSWKRFRCSLHHWGKASGAIWRGTTRRRPFRCGQSRGGSESEEHHVVSSRMSSRSFLEYTGRDQYCRDAPWQDDVLKSYMETFQYEDYGTEKRSAEMCDHSTCFAGETPPSSGLQKLYANCSLERVQDLPPEKEPDCKDVASEKGSLLRTQVKMRSSLDAQARGSLRCSPLGRRHSVKAQSRFGVPAKGWLFVLVVSCLLICVEGSGPSSQMGEQMQHAHAQTYSTPVHTLPLGFSSPSPSPEVDPVSSQTTGKPIGFSVAQRLGFRSPSSAPKVLALLLPVCTLLWVCFMMPGANAMPRVPPAWGPSMQATYPFRQWTQDLLIWSIATEGDASRKAALVVMQLKGTAQEYVRTIPPMALINGGFVNGVQVDPLTFLLHSLSERFAALGEEVRLGAITELLCFARQGSSETVDELMTRFDILRQRAHDQAQLTISITGLVWILLRAVGVSDNQLVQLLHQFQGRVPQTEDEFNAFKTSLRRMGHIIEHAPGNIASALRSKGSGGKGQQLYFAGQEQEVGWGQSEHSWAEPEHSWAGPAMSHESPDDWGSDAGTDTDTQSSQGEPFPDPLPEGDEDVTEQLYWAYQQAKSQWRRHMQKPVRAVRRFARRYLRNKGKGKGSFGKGKGRPNVSAFLAALDDAEVAQVFKGFRKGGGKRSSGKGKGRKQNPLGKDGKRLRCFKCGSEQHLSRACPDRRPSTGMQQSPPNQPSNFWAQTQEVSYTEGPLSGLIFMTLPDGDAPANVSDDSWSQVGTTVQAAPPDPWASYLRRLGVFGRPRDAEPTPAHPTSEPRSFGPVQAQHQSSQPQSSQPQAFMPQSQPVPWPFPPAPPPPPYPGMCPRSMAPPVLSTNPWATEASSSVPCTNPSSPAGMYAEVPGLGAHAVPFKWVSEAPTLPEWAKMPAFGYVTTPLSYQDPPPPPLMPGVFGSNDPGRSSVDPSQGSLLEGLHAATNSATQRWLGRQPTQVPGPRCNSSLDPAAGATVDNFHKAQGRVAARRQEARRLQQHRRILDVPRLADGHNYEATDGTCALCQEDYQPREAVFRLACRHIFHAQCWTDYLVHDNSVLACPICRGSARIVARFSYIEGCEANASPEPSRPPSETRVSENQSQTPASNAASRTHTPDRARPREFEVSTPPRPSAQEEAETPSPYRNFESFPWWAYSVLPRSPDFSSILVDPGAYTNLVGEAWVQEMAAKCGEHNLAPTQRRLANPLQVQGVGHGSQRAEYAVTMPVGFGCRQDGVETIARHHFEAPVITQGGRHLPALLGLKSLREKSAVLVMGQGEEDLLLILPGEQGMNLQPSPGSVIYPLTTAPSGHLLLRCDRFEQPRRVNLRPRSLVFASRMANAARAALNDPSPENLATNRRILEEAMMPEGMLEDVDPLLDPSGAFEHGLQMEGEATPSEATPAHVHVGAPRTPDRLPRGSRSRSR